MLKSKIIITKKVYNTGIPVFIISEDCITTSGLVRIFTS